MLKCDNCGVEFGRMAAFLELADKDSGPLPVGRDDFPTLVNYWQDDDIALRVTWEATRRSWCPYACIVSASVSDSEQRAAREQHEHRIELCPRCLWLLLGQVVRDDDRDKEKEE